MQQLLYYKHVANFVFVHINKCGGSSVEKALGIPFLHKTAKQYKNELGDERWHRIFSFTIVRNPWDRVVSHYHYRAMTNQTNLGTSPVGFNEWVELAYGEKNSRYYNTPQMFMPQTDWITDARGNVIIDFIARYENFQNDFNEICRRIGKSERALPHAKKSDRGNYGNYYTEESKKIVADWFSRDIELFGYHF